MLINPTDDSGLACVFAVKIMLTASAWASHLEGLWEWFSMPLGRGKAPTHSRHSCCSRCYPPCDGQLNSVKRQKRTLASSPPTPFWILQRLVYQTEELENWICLSHFVKSMEKLGSVELVVWIWLLSFVCWADSFKSPIILPRLHEHLFTLPNLPSGLQSLLYNIHSLSFWPLWHWLHISCSE